VKKEHSESSKETVKPEVRAAVRKPDSPEKKILDVRRAADFLGVSESIIRRLIKEHRIPFFQIEGRYLFYQPSLESWIEEKIVHPVDEATAKLASAAANKIWEHTQGR
jgi:excisionase family DNA binding protein